jgi:hypothetical protein
MDEENPHTAHCKTGGITAIYENGYVTMPWYMENAIMKAKDTANLWWQSCAP